MDIAGWEERYRSGERGREDSPTILVVEIAEKLVPGTAIDLACGAGRNALYLAEQGWAVTAVDGSKEAVALVQQRSAARGLQVHTKVADLTDPTFTMPPDAFDLVLIAYYLQRDLFAKVKAAVRPGGVVVAIAHTPEPGEEWSEKRAAPCELRGFFNGWELLWEYEGPSRDPAHRRPVAEIVAQRVVSRALNDESVSRSMKGKGVFLSKMITTSCWRIRLCILAERCTRVPISVFRAISLESPTEVLEISSHRRTENRASPRVPRFWPGTSNRI